MASLEAGFARELFVEWATDPSNLVLFTGRAQIGTLSRKLQTEPPPKVVTVTISKKIPLTGEELKAFEDQSSAKQETLKAAIIPTEEGLTPVTGTSPWPVVAITTEPVKSTEGCRGTKQLPFLHGIAALERTIGSCAHWFVGRTGKHLFLTDGSVTELPLLRKMVTDCKEGHYISSLGAFKKRFSYPNVVNNEAVGWKTSSMRFKLEEPMTNIDLVNPKYPHIIREEELLVEDLSANFRPLLNRNVRGQDSLEEEMVAGLMQIPWHKVDVRFAKRIQAHNLIQVKKLSNTMQELMVYRMSLTRTFDLT